MALQFLRKGPVFQKDLLFIYLTFKRSEGAQKIHAMVTLCSMHCLVALLVKSCISDISYGSINHVHQFSLLINVLCSNYFWSNPFRLYSRFPSICWMWSQISERKVSLYLKYALDLSQKAEKGKCRQRKFLYTWIFMEVNAGPSN